MSVGGQIYLGENKMPSKAPEGHMMSFDEPLTFTVPWLLSKAGSNLQQRIHIYGIMPPSRILSRMSLLPPPCL